MKKNMIWNMGAALLAQFVGVAAGFILPWLMLDAFGSEVNGLTQSVKQFLGIITMLDLGVGQVVRSSLYGPLTRGDRGRISRIMAGAQRFYTMLALALAGYVVLLMAVYPHLIDGRFGWYDTATLIGAMAVGSFAQYYFGIVNEQLLHADQRSYVISMTQILCTVLNVALCAYVLLQGCSVQMVKLLSSLVFLLKPVLLRLYINRRYRIDWRRSGDPEPIRQKWDGMAQHLSAVVLDGTDAMVLTVFSTLQNVSVYSVYYMVISSLQQLYQSATAGLHAAAGHIWARGDRAAQERMFSWLEPGLHYTTVFLFSCAGALMIPFVRVYTAAFGDAQYIQPLFSGLLVLAYGIRCLRTPYNIWILAAGHFRQVRHCHIIAAAVNLIVSVVCVIRFGLVGVAAGTLAAMVYQTAWMAWYNTAHLLCWPKGKVLKQFAADAVTAAAIFAAVHLFSLTDASWSGWFRLAVLTGVTALAVTGASGLLFYRRELLELLRWLRGRTAAGKG